MKDSRKKLLWFVVFIALIALTMFVIVQQNESFSLDGFLNFITTASWEWTALAFVCVAAFVIFEGLALLVLCKAFGYKKKFPKAIKYAAPDVYFSAITPSATGGQPASAYFMMKDKIPGTVTTIILLVNLTLYTLSILVVGVVCMATRPGIFQDFSFLSKALIIIGFVVQLVLFLFFILLVYKEKIVMKMAAVTMKLLNKLHIIRNVDSKLEKLKEVEKQYKECATAIMKHKKSLVVAFLLNLLQRVSLILVSVCVFIAKGGEIAKVFDVFITQGYVVLGSNGVPIPGAVGAADYLFIDGFKTLVNDPVSIELFSRGISFYCCVLVCGIITLAFYLAQGLKGMKQKKK